MAEVVREIVAVESLTASWIRPADNTSDAAAPDSNDWSKLAAALSEGVEAAVPDEIRPAEQDDIKHSFVDGQLTCAYMDLTTLPAALVDEYALRTIRLDISNNRFTQLPDLTFFSSLQELILDNNGLVDGIVFPLLPRLHTLSLNKNSLKELDPLLNAIEKSFPSLSFLSLLGNEVCSNELVAKDEDDYQRFRHAVLYRLPGIKFLDSRPVTTSERQEAKRIGAFTKVARFTDDEYAKQSMSQREERSLPYSPLSKETREPNAHKATIGQSKFAYYGRHSEGNRFIRNGDL
jgi:hypothetical protein